MACFEMYFYNTIIVFMMRCLSAGVIVGGTLWRWVSNAVVVPFLRLAGSREDIATESSIQGRLSA